MLSESALARRYIRESRDASDFSGRPVRLEAVCEVLDGEILVTGDGDVSGRLWVLAMEAEALADIVGEGDIAVVGDLPASQLAAIELGRRPARALQRHAAGRTTCSRPRARRA